MAKRAGTVPFARNAWDRGHWRQGSGQQEQQTMKRTATTVAFSALALAVLLPCAMAETIYVDQRYGPGGTGTSSAPYDTIQAAINDAGATEIIVFPGTYAENLAVTKAISIYGYDGPHTTRIDGSAGTDTISINRGITVRIEGLAISSGKRYGLLQPTEGTLRLRNCVFCGNTSHGLFLQRSESDVAPNVQIYNCIMVANGGSGLMLNGLLPRAELSGGRLSSP